ncbi:MAG: hypothetical protein SGPRY_002237 [Prymnesium sp.]
MLSVLSNAIDSIVGTLLQDERCAPSYPLSIRRLCDPQPSPVISAVLATALISLAPMIVLPLLPSVESERGRKMQPLLLHSMSEVMVGLAVLAGFMAFFLVEKVVRHQHAGSDFAHEHSHAHPLPSCDDAHEKSSACDEGHAEHDHEHSESDESLHSGGCQHQHADGAEHHHEDGCEHAHADGSEHQHADSTEHDHAPEQSAAPRDSHAHAHADSTASERKRARRSPARSRKREGRGLSEHTKPMNGNDHPLNDGNAMLAKSFNSRIAGYLNLAADAAHNFTDGLAIGAAYRSGWLVGASTTVAILIHEVPHEVGDVAILMQAGFTKRQAIKAQLSTAIGALLGTLISLAMGEQQSGLLLNFTAGGFIYVATVDVLPSLLHGDCSLLQTVSELGAMAAGISMMVLVLAMEG